MQVHLYGSVESRLCLTQNNDLDLTLVLGACGQSQQEPSEASAVVVQLGEALEQKGMQVRAALRSRLDSSIQDLFALFSGWQIEQPRRECRCHVPQPLAGVAGNKKHVFIVLQMASLAHSRELFGRCDRCSGA